MVDKPEGSRKKEAGRRRQGRTLMDYTNELRAPGAGPGGGSLLDYAIEREDWELAALCIVNGMLNALETLPRETVEQMIDELAGPDHPGSRHGRSRGSRRERHR